MSSYICSRMVEVMQMTNLPVRSWYLLRSAAPYTPASQCKDNGTGSPHPCPNPNIYVDPLTRNGH